MAQTAATAAPTNIKKLLLPVTLGAALLLSVLADGDGGR